MAKKPGCGHHQPIHGQEILAKRGCHSADGSTPRALTGHSWKLSESSRDGKYQNVAESPAFLLSASRSKLYVHPHDPSALPCHRKRWRCKSNRKSRTCPDLPVTQVQTMTESLQGANGFFFFRFGAQCRATMGFLGLILAVVGIYSVVSYAAVQRTRSWHSRSHGRRASRHFENGLASRTGRCRNWAGPGIGGCAGRHARDGKPVRGHQTQRSAHVYSSGPVVYGVALFACWIPAYRATRIDPLVALRYE